jgi:CheY-like chemotaxis protein
MIIENNLARAEINFCDDDEECLERTSDLIKRFTNYSIFSFHINGNSGHDEFIRHFYERDFDLTILDLRMPENWHEIFKSIRKKDPEHPIIIYTAYKEDYEDEMAHLHVTEPEDPLLKIIPKNGSIKVRNNLVPPVKYFAQISLVRKLNKQLSLMTENCNNDILVKATRSMYQVPDKIKDYAKALEEVSDRKHTISMLIDDLIRFLNSKDVWEYFYEKGEEQSKILLLIKKFLLSVPSLDITNDELKLICNILSALPSEFGHDILNNIYNSLKRLMRTKGISIIPSISNVDSLLKSYEDELWEEE